MADERQLRFLIAAGGTVGHVAPALAVAEALRRRDGLVTFAGSPDRVGARLVPELGYEFDALAVSGPRRRRGRWSGALLADGSGWRPTRASSSSSGDRSARASSTSWRSTPGQRTGPP